jgi:hypothetical protein
MLEGADVGAKNGHAIEVGVGGGSLGGVVKYLGQWGGNETWGGRGTRTKSF